MHFLEQAANFLLMAVAQWAACGDGGADGAPPVRGSDAPEGRS